tara:strand:- start:6341 stop:6832 length:492 start_codon:yes stop_codon:yes gene_type:complete
MRKLPDTITEQETISLIKKAKNKMKLAIALGFYQGLRVSEVISLTKSNIDMERGFIHVKQGKGNKDRDIPLVDEIRFYLRYIPITITRQGLHKSIKKIGKEVLNKDIHFHTLRHSGASFYLNERGVDLRHIQQFLGHSRLSTTEIYLHTNPIQLKQAFNNTRK